MKLLHILKNGKINELEVTLDGFSTRHVEKKGKIQHEGWAIKLEYPEKEHRYVMVFSPEEAKEFHKWLGELLPRFDTENLEEFIKDAQHED